MSARLKDKLCIITGAAREGGVGQGIAKIFAQNGAKLILLDILPIQLESLDDDIKSATLLRVKCDLSSEKNIIHSMKMIENKFKYIDVLVNNAAIFVIGHITECSESDWSTMFNVNVRGYALMIKHTLPMMRKHSSIINIASVAGIRALYVDHAIYCSTKAAIIQLTKNVAFDIWEKYNIRVNAVCPGSVMTSLLTDHVDKLVKQGKYKDFDDFFKVSATTLIMKRFCKTEEVGKACLFFASDDSSYCTGTQLIVDGGLSAL